MEQPSKRSGVERGQLPRAPPPQPGPVTFRPDLSPGSVKVHDSALNFLIVKKRESSEHKVMEAFVMEMFPKLQNNLRKVHELSLQAATFQPLDPKTEEGVKENNIRLNNHIAQAGRLFREFDQLLIETKTKALSFITQAEQGTFNIDEALKVAINDILNYSKGGTVPTHGNDQETDPSLVGAVGGTINQEEENA